MQVRVRQCLRCDHALGRSEELFHLLLIQLAVPQFWPSTSEVLCMEVGDTS